MDKFNLVIFWSVVFIGLECSLIFLKANKANKVDLFELIWFFIICFNLYMVVTPLLLFLKGADNETLSEFLKLSMLTLIFLLFGYLTVYFAEISKFNFIKNVTKDKKSKILNVSNRKKFQLSLFLILITSLFLLSYLESINLYYGSISFYLRGGHNIHPISESNLIGSFYGFVGVTGFSSIIIIDYIFSKYIHHIGRFFIIFEILTFIIFELWMGNRNNVLFLILPLLVIRNYNISRFRPFWIILILLVFIIGGELLGLIRQILVFNDFQQLKETLTLFPQNFLIKGEFTTSYNVFSIFRNSSLFKDSYFYGRTYIIDPLCNFIPRFLFPNRPKTIAQEFSFAYYGPGVNLGLGFSPIVEAIMNFDVIGIVIVFWTIGISLNLLYLRFIKYYYLENTYKRYLWLSIYSLIFPISVNFFRIDFATLFKLLFMRVLWIYIFLNIVRKILRNYEDKGT